MHWHGLSMAATPWSDGTPLISQWPIPPNSSFQYEFILYPDDAGTYFYHSHVGLQLSTASGPLIISPREICHELTLPSNELIMYIQDYWHKPDKVLAEGLLEDPFHWVGSSNTIYLNGISNGTSRGSHCSNRFPVIDVEVDTTYRLRWIHAGSLMYVASGIQLHNLTLIEADGTDLEPLEVEHVEMSPGQRLSTYLTTKSWPEILTDGLSGLYLIALSSRWRKPGLQNFAVLRYNKARTASGPAYIDMTGNDKFFAQLDLFQLPNQTFGWKDKQLRALRDDPAPENVNRSIATLDVQQTRWGEHGSHWEVNGRTYHEWNVTKDRPPYLVQLYQGLERTPSIEEAESGPEIYDPVSGTYVLEAGQVVDILIKNMPGDADTTEIHPWHFHSRKFWLMAQGQGNFNNETLASGRIPHPYRRDMVNVYPADGPVRPGNIGGWAMIRYQAQAGDAGVFPLHCHMSPHVLMGMLVVFTISPSTLPSILDSYGPYVIFNGEMYGKDDYVPPESVYFLDRVSPLTNRCDIKRS